MSVRHQNMVQQAEALYEEGPGDAGSSGRSSQSRSRSSRERGSITGSPENSDYEEEAADMSSIQRIATSSQPKNKGSKKVKAQRVKNKRGQKNLKPKIKHPGRGKATISPRIKPLEGLQQHICSAHVQRIKQLGSQAWELQRQLSEATTENKLLRQVQNRHTVALQHIQESQDGLPQVLLKHNNEVRAMQELLRKARVRRNSLARRLQSTEDELLRTKDALHHLQLLSKDCSLMEREELTYRLAEVSTDLDNKNRRIQCLERNLELSHVSFNRQMTIETRKTNEARELSGYLEAQIDQLTQKIKDRERQLDVNNIYSHRYPKGCNRKGINESKSVQTDNLTPLPIEAPCYLRLEYPNADKDLERSLVAWDSFAKDSNEAEAASPGENGEPLIDKECADHSEQDGSSDREDPQSQTEEGVPDEVAGNPQTSEGEQTEMFDNQLNPEDFLNLANLHSKDKSPRIKRHYTFKETIQNLHRGKPAYSSHTLRSSPPRYLRSQVPVTDLGSGSYEPSFMTLPAGRGLRCDAHLSVERAVLRKKSNLMKELFGQTQIVTLTTGKTRTKESDSDKLLYQHTGDASPERETKIEDYL